MVAGSIQVNLNDIDRLVAIIKALSQEGIQFHVSQESDYWHIEVERQGTGV